ncbi:hypothetical protein CG709_04710, partial [Lachnotalea glycerini]
MKILYLYQLDSTKIDIPFALSELGHEVHFIDAMLTDSFQNELIQEKIIQEVQSNPCECVITFNFYPYVSKAGEAGPTTHPTRPTKREEANTGEDAR